MRELRTEIEIDAPAERVWEVLMDFDSYPAWNPFITSLSGEARRGATLTARLEPPDGRGMTFKPAVVRVEAPMEFRWLGHFLVPRIFDGEHIFELHPSDSGTRFVQREEFGGLLVAPMLRWIGANTRRGFEEMNQALKERVEAGS